MAQPDPKPDERGPSSIEDEMEATRQRLAGTLDELLYRASPKTIVKREVTSVKAHYVDAAGRPRTDNILITAGIVVGVVAFFVVVRKIVR